MELREIIEEEKQTYLAAELIDCEEDARKHFEIYELLVELEGLRNATGKYRCFLCGEPSVIWNQDEDAEEIYPDRQGIFHSYHCMQCGAEYGVLEEFPVDEERGGK